MIDQHRLDKLRLWSNDPNAYAVLQPGFHYFDHECGFIAYRKVPFGYVVLGDPIANPENVSVVLSDYLKAFPNSVFNYVSESTALALREIGGKSINFMQIFYERYLELPYSFPNTRPVEGALKKAVKANLKVLERDLSIISEEELAQVKAINEVFIQESRVKREMGMISRTMSFEKEQDVRFFLMLADSEIIGFCTLDPWYENQKLVGYQMNQFRRRPTKIWGLYLSVVSILTEILTQEGVERLCLGGCIDLEKDENSGMPANKLWQFCRAPSIRMSDKFYGLTNLSKNKFEFQGVDSNRFIAAPYRIPILPLFMIARAFKQ